MSEKVTSFSMKFVYENGCLEIFTLYFEFVAEKDVS